MIQYQWQLYFCKDTTINKTQIRIKNLQNLAQDYV